MHPELAGQLEKVALSPAAETELRTRYLLPSQHSRANKPRVHVTLGLAFSVLLSGLQHANLRVDDFRLPRPVELDLTFANIGHDGIALAELAAQQRQRQRVLHQLLDRPL